MAEELIRRQIQTGAFAHVAKPVSTAALVDRIRALLGSRLQSDGGVAS